MKRRICNKALLVAILIIFLHPFTAVSAHAAVGNGHIWGQLLDGTNHNTPLAGQTVTLQIAQGVSAQDLTTSTTDVHGNFSFNQLATDKTIGYAVYVRYQGAQYISDIVTLDSKPVQQVNLTVYQATASTAHIAIVQSTVLLHEPDAQKGTLLVSEILAFKNLDTHTFVGSLDASKGKPKALSFTLPQDARNITLSKGFDGYQVIAVDRGFASNAALLPGDSEFAFTFEVPYRTSTYDFSYVAMYPTVGLSFLVPPDMHANSGVLTSQGVVTAEQHPYRLFQTSALLANQEVHVGLEGLPVSARAPVASSTSPIWLIVGFLLVLAILTVAWFIYRFKGRQDLTKQKSQMKKSSGKAIAAKPVKKISTPRDQEQVLLQELLDLDKALESGKLTKDVYQERRAKTKARLRALMSERKALRQ